MKISVVTPVFNGERFLPEAIESVLSQRGEFHLEYILVDGRSVDSSLAIANKYKRLVDEGRYSDGKLSVSMKIISQKDSGMYDGLANGFQLCSGDVIAYINSDDFYLPNSFSLVTKFFEKYSSIKWIVGAYTEANEYGYLTYIDNNFFPMESSVAREGGYGYYTPNYIPQESTFWRKELFKCIDFTQFRKYKYAGDFFLWFYFAKEYEICSVCRQLGVFRKRKGQLSSSYSYDIEVKEIVGDVVLSPRSKINLLIGKCEQFKFDMEKNRWALNTYSSHVLRFYYLFGVLVFFQRSDINECKLAKKLFITGYRYQCSNTTMIEIKHSIGDTEYYILGIHVQRKA